MPKTTGSGKPRSEELTGTPRRSPGKAQRAFAKARDSAAGNHGDEERARRVAPSAPAPAPLTPPVLLVPLVPLVPSASGSREAKRNETRVSPPSYVVNV